jgi:hypothetical protein
LRIRATLFSDSVVNVQTIAAQLVSIVKDLSVRVVSAARLVTPVSGPTGKTVSKVARSTDIKINAGVLVVRVQIVLLSQISFDKRRFSNASTRGTIVVRVLSVATGSKIAHGGDRSQPVSRDIVANGVRIASGIVNLHAGVVIVQSFARPIVVVQSSTVTITNVTVVRGEITPATVVTRSRDLLGHCSHNTVETVPNVVEVSELHAFLNVGAILDLRFEGFDE